MNQGVKEDKWIIWAICLKPSDEIIGTLSVWNINTQNETAELGYGIFSDYRYKGYMSEAILSVENFTCDVMKVKRLEAYTSTQNKPSRKLLEKLSYQLDKVISEEGSSGSMVEMVVYYKTFK